MQPVKKVSIYGSGVTGQQQLTRLLLAGMLVLSFFAGLRRALTSGKGSVWGLRLIALFGLGLLLAGVFPTNPGLGYPPGVEPPMATSLAGNIHDFSGMLVSLNYGGVLPGAPSGLFEQVAMISASAWISLLAFHQVQSVVPQ
jgi:hypothetical protein